MGRKADAKTVLIIEGLYLKRISTSPNWQASCQLRNTYLRKSTGTADERQATIAALEWFFLLRQRVELGIRFQRISFNNLTENFLKTVIGDNKFRFYRDTIERHLVPYFGDLRDIRKITDGMVSDYLVERRNKKERQPLPQTLNRENTVLRQLLNFAVMQKWLPEKVIVPYINQSQTVRRRRHFTPEEYGILIKQAKHRIKEAQAVATSRHTINNRRLLLDAIIIMANSGLRVDELHRMTWRNMDWTKGDLKLEYVGKRKSARKMVLRYSAIAAIARIGRRRQQWLEQQGEPSILNPNERIMSMPSGIPIASFKKMFRLLLEECGFEYKNANERHSLTSLRHTYATRSLTQKHRLRPTMEALAKQMGTSPRMIEQYYGHDDVEDYRDELRGKMRT